MTQKSKMRLSLSIISILLFSMLLSACSLFGGEEQPAATPTPENQPTNPPINPAANFELYQGDGFSIKYPQGWEVTEDPDTQRVTISEPATTLSLVIQSVPNPGGLIAPETAVDVLIQATLPDAEEQSSEAVTINGQEWQKKTVKAEVEESSSGQKVPATGAILTTNYPADNPNTQAYGLIYAAPDLIFATTDTTIFQPMVNSFEFTA